MTSCITAFLPTLKCSPRLQCIFLIGLYHALFLSMTPLWRRGAALTCKYHGLGGFKARKGVHRPLLKEERVANLGLLHLLHPCDDVSHLTCKSEQKLTSETLITEGPVYSPNTEGGDSFFTACGGEPDPNEPEIN